MAVSFFVFLFGLCIGSFLNCVIYRLEEKQSFSKGRSYCPSCKHQLSWKDLIPILSYVFLLGHCRYCKKKISIQYPLVELATGILFILAFNADHIVQSIYFLLSISFLIIIFVSDLKHYIIPDKVILPAILISLAYNTFSLVTGDFTWSYFVRLFWAGFLPALFFFSLFFFSRGKWIGFGDVKLALFMGFLLGPNRIIAALFLAFLAGSVIGMGLIIFGKKKMKSEVPFGPFLVSGTLVSLFWGIDIINWYLNIFIK